MRRIVRNRVALRLQFLDGSRELRHRRADVRQLDDVGVGQLSQPAEFGQVVGHALVFGQVIGKLGEDACRHRDVTGLDVDARRLGEGPNDRQEGVGRKQRRFVGQRVDDGRLLGAHALVVSRVCFGQAGYQYSADGCSVSDLGPSNASPLAAGPGYEIRFSSVKSASVKPRLAGRQPSNRGGVPRVKDQVEKPPPATRQARVRDDGPRTRQGNLMSQA